MGLDGSGERSQPSRAAPRSGRARRNVDSNAATRRRAVRSSPITRSRDTIVTVQPRSRATPRDRRALRSSEPSIAWMSGTTLLTSTTSSDPVGGWKARMSIEPRSPATLNETSGSASQPDFSSLAITDSTKVAWATSSRRSSASPFQLSRTSTRAPTAAATASSARTVTRSACPSSILETVARDTPAAAPRSSWRQPRRRRSALIPRPNRTESIGRI